MNKTLLRLTKRRKTHKKAFGAVPGQLVHHEGSVNGQIRVIHFDSKTLDDRIVDSVGDLAGYAASETTTDETAAPRRKGVTWINIDGVGDIEKLGELSRLFGIHPLAMEDVVNVHQHAKLEFFGDTFFFVARMPSGADGFNTEQVSLFLIDGVVITIQERPGDCLEPVRYRIANKLGRIRRRRSDYLAYAIIDAIVDGYFPLLDQYSEKLDEAGTLLENGGDRSLPLHLHNIRSDLLLIRKVVNQHRVALNEILRDEAEIVGPDTALYFRDCQDHIQQLMEAADTDRETCGELRELYFAMLGEKNNDVMKVLTIIATIFIPMSFVAGIYGMNFDSDASMLNMPELHWAFGYPFALALMATMAGGLLAFLYRKGWLA
ncbi:magnesium/cobalt transporter CorA [Rubripirellula tenax]|uniref:magnesium/cobalt transporter CorA n=1 Tax=Rubripirellula tenax TaxID=2528015 RepID=UPI001FE696C0|nr:magnesium/cobalt transporter CorA [Rubripirellula tenax]